MQEFVRCFISSSSKVDAIESALTFLHDNLHDVDNFVLVLSPASVHSPRLATELRQGGGDA